MTLQLAPVYKYYAKNPWRFLYSTDPDIESGWTRAGVSFFAFGEEQPDTVPVYRFVALNPVRFLYSTNPQNGQGWTNEGVAFYAFQEANEAVGTTYVYQMRAQNPWRYQYVTKYDNNAGDGWEIDNLAFHVFDAEAVKAENKEGRSLAIAL